MGEPNRRARRARRLASALVLASVAMLLGASSLSAHRPILVGAAKRVDVPSPETARCFYAELPGEAAIYTIRSSTPIELYANIRVPDLPGVPTDFWVEVYRDGRLFGAPDSIVGEWQRVYEPFENSAYLQGPVYKDSVAAGTYEIRVSSPTNTGKYILAVGENEEFILKKAFHAMLALPRIKRDYFHESPWTFLAGRSGGLLLASLGIIVVASISVSAFLRRARRERSRSA